MELQKAFTLYKKQVPTVSGAVQSTSLSLRRGGVCTLEQLGSLYRDTPEVLETIRGIGPNRMDLIGRILRYFAARAPAPPGSG